MFPIVSQIMVDVNMKTSVMAMEGKGVSKGRKVVGEVAILNVDPGATIRQQSLGYMANVTVACNGRIQKLVEQLIVSFSFY